MKARSLAILLLFEGLALLAASCAQCFPIPLLVASLTTTQPPAIAGGDPYILSTHAPQSPSSRECRCSKGAVRK
jgi:hypothetical protein